MMRTGSRRLIDRLDTVIICGLLTLIVVAGLLGVDGWFSELGAMWDVPTDIPPE